MKESKSEIAEAYLNEAVKKLEKSKKLLDDHYTDEAARAAYYSMYHAAKALLALENIEPKTHHGVISELQRLYVKTGKLDQSFASAMARDLQVRIRADYEIMVEVTKEMAEESVIDAKNLLNEAKRILK